MVKKPRNERTKRPTRRGMAHMRLTQALETLTKPNQRPTRPATVAELCRLAKVSRNSLYRYHTPILQALRKHHPRGPKSAQAKAKKSAEQRRTENVALREDISKLAALVDHYYTAFQESRVLLERRDRELAELRRGLNSRPVPLLSR
jgi:hypothetical protein